MKRRGPVRDLCHIHAKIARQSFPCFLLISVLCRYSARSCCLPFSTSVFQKARQECPSPLFPARLSDCCPYPTPALT